MILIHYLTYMYGKNKCCLYLSNGRIPNFIGKNNIKKKTNYLVHFLLKNILDKYII